jgi:hypothetical protein
VVPLDPSEKDKKEKEKRKTNERKKLGKYTKAHDVFSDLATRGYGSHIYVSDYCLLQHVKTSKKSKLVSLQINQRFVDYSSSLECVFRDSRIGCPTVLSSG